MDKKNGKTCRGAFVHSATAANHPLMFPNALVARRKGAPRDLLSLRCVHSVEGCTKLKACRGLEAFNDFNIHLTALELIHDNVTDAPTWDQFGRGRLFSLPSSRLRKPYELIDDGHRILIFSVWTTCLDLLSCLLEQQGLDYL
jgi:SNF2 family DNA or RNA helicase